MIQYHILQTNIKRTVWQRVKFLPFEIPSIQCVPFLVVKFTSIVPLIMAENGLKFFKILLPAVIKIRENTVLVFQYILRFWNQTSIVNSFLNISRKCSLVNKTSKFSLQVSVSSFNKVVLHNCHFYSHFRVDRNKYQIHIPLPPKIDPTVTMMQVIMSCCFQSERFTWQVNSRKDSKLQDFTICSL